MKETTKKQIIELIELDNITDPTDERIEALSDRFPEEFEGGEDEIHTDQLYAEFQQEIASMVENR